MPALSRPVIRICCRLWADDYDKIRRVAEMQGIGMNEIIRHCIHDYIMRLTDRERRAIDSIGEPNG